MKIIFLDLDGVLVTADDPKSLRGMAKIDGGYLHHFNPKCVKALNELTDLTKSKFVISSTWRRTHKLSTLRKHFINEGVTGKIIGKTPILTDREAKSSVHRGIEIQWWITQNEKKVSSFVIIDDDSDQAHLMKYLVKTRFRDWDNKGIESGFTKIHIPLAVEILNKNLDK